MEIKKEEKFTDKEGKKIRRIYRNGIEETILVEPSQWYKDNILKPAQQESKLEKERREREGRIADKIKQIAIEALQKYQCSVCSYIYDPEIGDPEHGIEPDTPWKEVPKDWVCPECGAKKAKFKKYKE